MAYAVVEKSGCVVRKGNCQLRLDFFLDAGEPRYEERYLQLVDLSSPAYLAGYGGEVDKEGQPKDQEDYDKWYQSLPRVWQNTPFHSHFVYLAPDFTEQDLRAMMNLHLGNFYKAFQNRWDAVPGGMKHGWATKTRIKPNDYSKADTRVAHCESRIAMLTELSYRPSGDLKGEEYAATPIDVGPAAIARAGELVPNYTFIALENPANDTGWITTFEIWAVTSMTGTNKVGTFYGAGTSYTNRDGETIGTVTSGAKRTFTGLIIDVSSGDFAGMFYSLGKLEGDTAGTGTYFKSADQFGTGTQTYAASSVKTVSLYGTGDTDYPESGSGSKTAHMGATLIGHKML